MEKALNRKETLTKVHGFLEHSRESGQVHTCIPNALLVDLLFWLTEEMSLQTRYEQLLEEIGTDPYIYVPDLKKKLTGGG